MKDQFLRDFFNMPASEEILTLREKEQRKYALLQAAVELHCHLHLTPEEACVQAVQFLSELEKMILYAETYGPKKEKP